jgi:beta-glucanase (GH16 family)
MTQIARGTFWCMAMIGCFTGRLAAQAPTALPLIDFSAAGAEQRVSATSDQVTFTRLPGSAGGKLNVSIRPGKESYPGINIKPAEAAWDLSAFGHIDLRLTNTGEKPVVACLRVDGDADWKLSPWNSENGDLAAGSTQTIRVRFGYSWGKRGYAINPARVAHVMVFLGKSDAPQSFRVEAIEAGGTPGEKPAVPPGQIRTRPKDGILLGNGTSIDGPRQLEPGKAEVKLIAGEGRQSLLVSSSTTGEASVRLKPAIGRWDLSDYTQVTLHVRNPGKPTINLRARLESAGGDSPWTTPSGPVAPGAEQDITILFAGASIWNGDPCSGAQFNSDATTAVAFELLEPGPGQQLLVDFIRAETSPPAQVPDWLGKRPPVEGKWVQTLDDNFDGTTVDPAHWDIYGDNYWDKQSHFSRDNVIIGGGVARLRFEKKRGHADDDPKKPQSDYATGFLTSFGKWTQRYGYFEARMKLPTAPGLWPAFWMMPDRGPGAKNRGATEDGGMEFDIMEFLTRFGPNRYNIAMHWDGYGKNHKSTGSDRIYVRPDKDGFITSGMLWEPGKLTFYCNGSAVAAWANPRVSNVPAHLMFTLPCGGWGGNDLDDTGLPDDFIIDWVRAWQREDLKD